MVRTSGRRMSRIDSLLVSSLSRQKQLGLAVAQYALVSSPLSDSELHSRTGTRMRYILCLRCALLFCIFLLAARSSTLVQSSSLEVDVIGACLGELPILIAIDSQSQARPFII